MHTGMAETSQIQIAIGGRHEGAKKCKIPNGHRTYKYNDETSGRAERNETHFTGPQGIDSHY